MKILHEDDARPLLASAAAVGFFDGVHFGHRFLLENVKAIARQRNLATMTITFGQHPLAVLRSEGAPALLTTTAERIALIEAQGIDLCAMLDFSKEFSMLSARDFMLHYLVGKLNVKALVIGYDHSLGHDKHLTFEDYRSIGEELGISVMRAAKYMPPSGVAVSSTSIRRALQEGRVGLASTMLGRQYSIGGTVVEGRHVGTGLGFPTANINVAESGKIVPLNGVYSALVHTGGETHRAVVNIGTRPTLHNGSDTTVEAFLPGFSGNLYGAYAEVEFLSRLRDEKRFDTLDELRAQIARDVETATAAM